MEFLFTEKVLFWICLILELFTGGYPHVHIFMYMGNQTMLHSMQNGF